MNDYRPRPGSAAEAAVEFLRKKGGPARSGEIAEAIGIETKNLTASLSAAVENGVLVACDVQAPGAPPQKEYRLSGGGKPIPWREPKPTALPPSPSPASGRGERSTAAQEAAKPARKPRKPAKPAKPHPRGAGRPKATARLLRAAEEGQQRKAAKRLPVAEVPWKAEQPAGGFRCGIFNDGALSLVLRDGGRVELPPDDTRVLFDYLDKTLQVAA
jgi:hypothetical protein